MKINDLINKVKTSVDSKLSKEKKQEIKYYFRMGFRLLIIAALTASLTAFVYSITKDRIAENELAVMEDALEKIFDGCDELKSVKGDYEEPVSAVYEVYDGGQRKGYAIQVAPVGFKDKIGIVVGTDNYGKCMGVEITSISDTPGVGTKVKDRAYLDGFIGLSSDSVDGYDVISGATISSTAVKKGIAAALSLDVFKGDVIDESTSEEQKNESPDESTSGEEATGESVPAESSSPEQTQA